LPCHSSAQFAAEGLQTPERLVEGAGARAGNLPDIGQGHLPGIEGIDCRGRQPVQCIQALAQAPQRLHVVVVGTAPDAALQVLHDQQALCLGRGSHQCRGQPGRRGGAMQDQFARTVHARPAPGRTVQAQHEASRGAVDPVDVIDGAAAEPLDALRRRALFEARHARQGPCGRPIQHACRRYCRSHARNPNTAMVR
jgi:hypothetical protein